MTKKKAIYLCSVCGNLTEVLHASGGELACCGQPMRPMLENTVEAAKEKHIPVLQETADGLQVTVGAIPHPMEEKHYIEWIEVIDGDFSCKQFLKPGDKPEASLCASNNQQIVRAYCNLHGLWTA